MQLRTSTGKSQKLPILLKASPRAAATVSYRSWLVKAFRPAQNQVSRQTDTARWSTGVRLERGKTLPSGSQAIHTQGLEPDSQLRLRSNFEAHLHDLHVSSKRCRSAECGIKSAPAHRINNILPCSGVLPLFNAGSDIWSLLCSAWSVKNESHERWIGRAWRFYG